MGLLLAYLLLSFFYHLGFRIPIITGPYTYVRYKKGIWDDITKQLFINEIKSKKSYLGFYYGIEFIWKIDGVTSLIVEQTNFDFKQFNNNQRANIFALLSSTLFKKDNDLSFQLYKRSQQINPEAPKSHLQLYQFSNDAYSSKYKKLYDTLITGTARLPKLFSDLSSYSVVGNSQSEKGSFNGKKIDSANTVIRFNHFSTSTDYVNDYGSKTDIWVLNPSILQSSKANQNSSKILIISAPLLYGIKTKMWRHLDSYIEKYDIMCYEEEVYRGLAAKLEAPPSAGLLLLKSIHSAKGSVSRNSIFGFDHSEQHYYERKKMKNSRHNWIKEKELTEQILNESLTT